MEGKLKSLTVNDVAKVAGVSVATVSRVLSGLPTVMDENRERVLSVIQEIGFAPNRVAQTLRRGRGQTVALLTSDIEQGTSSKLARHVQHALERAGRDMLLYNLNHDADRLIAFLQSAPGLGLGGIIIFTTDRLSVGSIMPLIDTLRAQRVPIVATSRELSSLGVSSVLTQDREACRASTRYLLREHGAPVAFLGRVAGSEVGAERLAGFEEAHADAGVAIDRGLIWDVSYRFAAGCQAMNDAIRRRLAFRAIQCASDELAMGALAALHDNGIAVPHDVAVMGFGNLELSKYTRPSLSSVRIDVKRFAEALSDSVKSEEFESVCIPFDESRFIIRDSA